MIKSKIVLPIFLTVTFVAFFFISPKPASAFSFGELFTGIKNAIILPFISHDLSIDQKVELAPGGDVNKNGQIDAGDTVKFSYIITNPTKNSYKSATLNTNVNTKEINTISNIQGVLSLDSSKDIIYVPHLIITPNQVRTISFIARVNFNKNADQSISTEAELVDDKKSSLFKAEKKEINAKKLDSENFNKFVHITK